MEELEKQLPAFKRAAARYTKRVCRTKKSAMDALIKSGIYDASGKLVGDEDGKSGPGPTVPKDS